MAGSVPRRARFSIPFAHEVPRHKRRVRLGTLNVLRWFAIGGQGIAALFAFFILELPIPIVPVLGIVGIAAAYNLTLEYVARRHARVLPTTAQMLLIVDLVETTALLHLTGGLTNPFSIVLAAPIIVSAVILPPFQIAQLGLATSVAATILLVSYRPLLPASSEAFAPDLLLLCGEFVALITVLAFVTIFLWYVAEERERMLRGLHQVERSLMRFGNMRRLDGLAAAAAHALGTPLSTISTIATEMVREAPKGSDSKHDLEEMCSQISRCRQILESLSPTAGEWIDADQIRAQSLPDALGDMCQPYYNSKKCIQVLARGQGNPPEYCPNAALQFCVANLIENALRHAHESLLLTVGWSEDTVSLAMVDDGPGFPTEVLRKIGEPYLAHARRSTAPVAVANRRDGNGAHVPEGLGLGLFIVVSLMEQTGAKIAISNREEPDTGARVEIVWKRDDWRQHFGDSNPTGVSTATEERSASAEQMQGMPTRS